MDFDFFIDPDFNAPHIYKHEVSEAEIYEFFTEIRYIEYERKDQSRVAYGQLSSGRYLQVVYRADTNDRFFIITAFDLQDGEIIAILEGLE